MRGRKDDTILRNASIFRVKQYGKLIKIYFE
jgi:hypothetical protein